MMGALLSKRLTFSAWSISPQTRLSHPIDVSAAATLKEAADIAVRRCHHKDTFTVLMGDAVGGTGTLHVFYVKQSSKTLRIPHGDGTWRVVRPLVADPVTSMEVSTFAPVEPWRWERGADAVGVEPALIEVRA